MITFDQAVNDIKQMNLSKESLEDNQDKARVFFPDGIVDIILNCIGLENPTKNPLSLFHIFCNQPKLNHVVVEELIQESAGLLLLKPHFKVSVKKIKTRIEEFVNIIFSYTHLGQPIKSSLFALMSSDPRHTFRSICDALDIIKEMNDKATIDKFPNEQCCNIEQNELMKGYQCNKYPRKNDIIYITKLKEKRDDVYNKD